jgi:hypothetical protein
MQQIALSQLVSQLGLPFAVAGLSAHLLYWSQGERSNKDVRIWLYSHFTVNVLLLVYSYQFLGLSIVAAVLLLNGCFYTPLYVSMLIHRTSFHRLRRFPGPFILRLSKLAALYANMEKNQDFARVWALHKQYGDIVRTGPQELSILDVGAVDAIYGPASRCTRAPWYDQLNPPWDTTKKDFSVFHMRDPDAHAKRRKGLWDKAFNIKCLPEHIPMGHFYY